eukprot:3790673-Amphidinium_carterae.2
MVVYCGESVDIVGVGVSTCQGECALSGYIGTQGGKCAPTIVMRDSVLTLHVTTHTRTHARAHACVMHTESRLSH